MFSLPTLRLARQCARFRPVLSGVAVRCLNIHEFQAMDLLRDHGLPVPSYHVAKTAEEASNIFCKKLNQPGTVPKQVVIKAQVLSGGRGKGTFADGFQGGVHICSTTDDARNYASKMLGNVLVTKQNKAGLICHRVLLVEKIATQREVYLSILYDRVSQGIIILGSPSGGMSIEEVAQQDPSLIFKMPVDIAAGPSQRQYEEMAHNLGFSPGTEAYQAATDLMANMYAMFLARDCSQIEINPLVETPDGKVVCLDAKCTIDDNAHYRQMDLFDQRDYTQEDPCEADAEHYDLNYVHLDGGWIGCLVNGAGLAMATMDLIHIHGGEPAVFLDCGGGASEAQVRKAFEIMNKDPFVRSVFVNIFGGILRCDDIARGIVQVHQQIGVNKPVVVRLRGNKAKEAAALLDKSNVPVVLVDDYEAAAQKAIELAQTSRGEAEENEKTVA